MHEFRLMLFWRDKSIDKLSKTIETINIITESCIGSGKYYILMCL